VIFAAASCTSTISRQEATLGGDFGASFLSLYALPPAD